MALPWLVRSGVKAFYERRIFDVADTPSRQVALVFGAAVYGDRLSTILRDRVDTAVALFHSGRVQQIIVSGHSDGLTYDEPRAMKAYAVSQGVPAEAVIVDNDGHRTYDSCYNARNTFDVSNAVLVTQAFHLPRALMTCGWLGIDAVGTAADVRPYRGARWYELRETGATLVAFWDVIRNEPPAAWESGLESG